ncbi:hypothetical protein Pse7367_3956 (plasmid) [Thalassoporum mexicanum PCC 7367]|uniref:phage tail fiber protein n=1 Tax=Thalassoporum mexicanum TaxID=3457544 RepID=UPI00029FCE18|nr:hypothetical protein [Pseudanabaena sp. PCC 7367]AFY72171.1 hypothetical protein Pse7367_3956 [Pseudanabaena sp. PCC 7367]
MAFTESSNFWEEQKLNHLLDNMEEPPTSLEVRLYQGVPEEAGTTVNDVTVFLNNPGVVTFDAPLPVGDGYQIANSAVVDFGTAADDVNVDHVALWANISGGWQMIAYTALSSQITFLDGDPATINAGEIKVTMQENWGATVQQTLLNWIRGTIPTSPTDLYVALYTAAPGAGGGGTEVTNNIRSTGRPQPAEVDMERWNEPVAAAPYFQITNKGKIDFGASDNNLASDITHVGIFDAISGGNLLMWGILSEPLPVLQGDRVFFEPGQLVLRAA